MTDNTETPKAVKKQAKPRTKKTKGTGKEATQFKPGHSGNPNGARANFRKPTMEMRNKLHEAITQAGMPMLINLIYDTYEAKDRKDMLNLLEFMFKYTYGLPREMYDYEIMDDVETKQESKPLIVIQDRETLTATISEDEKYL